MMMFASASLFRVAQTVLAVATAALLLTGCGAAPEEATTRSASADGADARPISSTDPCAMRLHDLSGDLLLFYFTHGRLPDELSELAELPGAATDTAALTCPESDAGYIYNPNGILLAEQGTYVVLYDPAPVHAGMRWAITVREPDEGGTLIAKVVALPERFFALRPPASER